MAKREIEDDEYEFLQSRKQVADFVESIYNDPALSKEAKGLIKRKYPTLQIPDYDIEEKVEARLTAAEKKREEEEAKRRQEAEDERISNIRNRTQQDYGFTDEAMTKLEKLMVDRNIGDYEVAANYMASKEPKASDSAGGEWDSTRWHHEKKDGFAEIAKDPEAWGRNEIMQAMRRDEQKDRGRGF
jgi:hypothetical protein